jgi:tetratricopeptide (TPR) repeat protein
MSSVASFDSEEQEEGAAHSELESESAERLCERAIDMAYSGEPRQGLTLAFKARKLARQRGSVHDELLALNAGAICQRLRGDVISAVAAAVDAHTLANKVGDRAMLCHALCTIGSSAFALDTLDESARLLERCVEEAVAIGDPQLEIRVRDELGVVLGDMQKFDLAQAEFDRALKLVEQHNEHRLRARLLMRIGNLHKKRASAAQKAGREEEAEESRRRCEHWAHRALEAAKGESAAYLRLNVLSMLGQLEIGRGDERAALEWLHQSLGLAQRTSRRAPIPHLLTEIGRLHEARGDPDEARTAYEEAFAEAGSMRPTWRLAEIGFLLADLEERCDNPDTAAKWREIAETEQAQFEISRKQAKQQMAEMRKKLGSSVG